MQIIAPLLSSHREALEALCRAYRVSRLDIFGSAATAAFDSARSDLDFLVTFEACTPEEHARRYFGLASALEDLFMRPVDLVEEPAITNPYFKRGVEETRANLYAA